MDGCIADAGDGGEHACPIDLLLCLLTVCRTFDYELWEIDLSCSDITLYGWNDWRRGKKKSKVVQDRTLDSCEYFQLLENWSDKKISLRTTFWALRNHEGHVSPGILWTK